MPARSLIVYPDPRLRRPAAPVTVFDADLRGQAEDLRLTLDAASAIGLTGPHVGLAYRLVVLRLAPAAAVSVYVNPAILWASPERASQSEGSVAMPGIIETVERAARVRVSFRDLDGPERVEEADGFLAACLQHEIDQLDGIFWIDRLSRLKRERVLKRFAKLRRGP